ncbi:MAG: hypothetical protein NTY80_00150 [candidate division SR1 bacterium]|nr:hypothetical protein [candidate division SR1 bacterium]
MMLLFLALMIVYVVWYQVKGNAFKNMNQSENSGSDIQIISKSGSLMPTISSVETTNENEVAITTGTKNKTGNIVPVTISKLTTGTMNKNTSIKLLSGTSVYYGPIEVIEKLGIKYQYALADEKGIRYVYLGTPSYDFASIARALKGSLYTLATEQDIIQNKLFGNKVVFINLPEYKDKQVIMFIYLNDGIWMVQMEYSLYHKSKAYLKSLFID